MAALTKRLRSDGVKTAVEILLKFPFYIVTHPFKGFDDMKQERRGDMRYALFMLVATGLLGLIRSAYTGFVVTEFFQAVPFVNVPWVLAMAYAPIVLFVLANWSVTTVTEGKGNMREIFLTYCYAMYLSLFCTVIGIIVSNFVTVNEVAFASFFFTFGQISGLFYLFIGLVVVHEYTFGKAIVMVILTVLSMLVITFVLALFFALLSNVVMFFSTVITELNAHHLLQ